MTIEKRQGDLAPGRELFHSASEFYSWYMGLINAPDPEPNVFRTLSALMRIALLSAEGGGYLSSGEEQETISGLFKLREGLCDGTLNKKSTFPELQSLMEGIIAQNPKAKLVAYATELEYRFCIRPAPTAQTDRFQSYLQGLLKHVNPSLLEVQAYAVNQIIGRILENPSASTEGTPLIEKEIDPWLRVEPKYR